jgi:hypothetical protein
VDHDGAFGPKHSESGLKVPHGTFESVVRVDENDVVRQGWIEEVGDLVIRTAEGDFGAVLESGRTAVHKPVAPVKAGLLDLGEAEAGAGSADFKVPAVAMPHDESVDDFVLPHFRRHHCQDL